VGVLGAEFWFIGDAISDRTRLRGELAATRSDLKAAQASLELAAETARIHRAHLDRAAEEARGWVAISNDLQSMKGRHAPLSPLLSATADRLFGSRQPADPPAPKVSADLLQPCVGYTGPVPSSEGQISDALIAEARGRNCANGKLATVAEILNSTGPQ